MESETNKRFFFDEFEIDDVRRLLLKQGKPVNLNPKALDLLVTLVKQQGRILSKDELLNSVWANQFVEENNLTVHITALRKALGESKNEHRFIVTVPGKGYKFVGGLSENKYTEIVVETHKFKHIVVDEEVENDSSPDSKSQKSFNAKNSETNQRKFIFVCSIVGIGLLAAVFGGLFLNTKYSKSKPIKFTKLTSSGKVTGATATFDGKYAVFSQVEKDGESLWLKQIATGSGNQILKTQPVNFVGLAVSPDDSFIYATVFSGDLPDPQVWKIPLLGGSIEQIKDITTGAAVSLSPDGKRFAFTESHSSLKETQLLIANVDGSNKNILVHAKDGIRSFPNFKANPVAWSPATDEIASAVEETMPDGGSKTSILLVNTNNASEKVMTQNRWDYVENLAWIDAETLVVTGSLDNRSQIWAVSRKTGETRQITDDISNYSWLANANGNVLAVQKSVVSKVIIGEFDESRKTVGLRQVFEESGAISNVNWAKDGKILFSSSASGNSEIWRIDSDGAEKTQLTTNSNLIFGFTVSPADGSLLFSATENGKHSLRSVDSEGKNMRRVSNGTDDVFPNYTPDGQSVIFQRGVNNKNIDIWRLDLKDGNLTQLTKNHAIHPTISPDGTKTAFYFMDNQDKGVWKIGIISNLNGEFSAKINLPKEATERRMRWHPNGSCLSIIAYQGEDINLLLLPVNMTEAIEKFSLGKGSLQWFEWAKDGNKIVFSQTAETQDIVLLNL